MEEKNKADFTKSCSNGGAQIIVEDESIGDLRCGYFDCRPNWLQSFNTPRFLLACVSWFTFTQGFVVNGIVYTNFTSWERRYGLSGTDVAWISSSYDLAASVFTLLFGYIGQWMHNGRILCIGAYFMSMGSFIMTLPHFISGIYTLGPRPIDTCDINANQTITDCEGTDSSYLGYFMLAQCFHAVGGAAVYTLAIPFMDDQIKTKNTPVYIGIMQGNAAFGPAMGYICGGIFLSFYVDINKDIDFEIEPGDPRWVGAWWIGLLYSGFAALTVGFLIGCFPRELPSARKYRAERKSEAHKVEDSNVIQDKDFGKSLSGVLKSLKLLFTNAPFLLITFAGTVESGGVVAFGAFLPKIMQLQFAQTPTRAAALGGAVVVPGAAGGQILGGLLPRWLNLRFRGLMVQSLICSILGVLLSFSFLIRCDTVPIAGVTVPYFNDTFDEVNVVHPCNAACNCTTESYDPTCGSDDIEYFTPCHAGCTDSFLNENYEVIYTNCSCIAAENAPSSSLGWATDGICASDCNAFGIFLVFFLFINLVTFISSTSGQAGAIRCVHDNQRSLGFAVRLVILRLLGSVPGPIVFGLIFDTACIQFQELCNEKGSCWIYDTKFIAEALCYSCIVIKSVASLCFFGALFFYKPPSEDTPTIQDTVKAVSLNAEGRTDSSEDLKSYASDLTETTYM